MLILRLWDLSTLCVVDQLWPLTKTGALLMIYNEPILNLDELVEL